ncbi:hypothetical protein [Fulvimarina manganoxydans]|uniref:hypothetical protein n=1 Tax=Fulvimarina manganoxydans TaxID=937218 RepID=UPI001482F672|nr:hypothetical protein [Fulvimarina manganoxydans]
MDRGTGTVLKVFADEAGKAGAGSAASLSSVASNVAATLANCSAKPVASVEAADLS